MNRAFKKVSHVIFDMDGLLLDSERVYRNVISTIAKRYGKVYTSTVMSKLLGTPQWDTCKIAVREMQLPITPERFNDEFNVLSHKSLVNIGLLPGADKLVRHLHRHNVPIAVATSSSRDSYDLKTQKHQELFSLFSHKVTGGSDPDVTQGKPSPDIFLICAARFPDRPQPDKCLVLEDAPNGVRAAIDAGMQCVMVPDKKLIPPEFQKEATLVLDSLEQIEPEQFGLPPFK